MSNKQPFYHQITILFTATMDVSDSDRKLICNDFRRILQRQFGKKVIVEGSVEVDSFDAEPGDPADLMD